MSIRHNISCYRKRIDFATFFLTVGAFALLSAYCYMAPFRGVFRILKRGSKTLPRAEVVFAYMKTSFGTTICAQQTNSHL